MPVFEPAQTTAATAGDWPYLVIGIAVVGGALLIVSLILYLRFRAQFRRESSPQSPKGQDQDVIMSFSNKLARDEDITPPPDEDASHELVKAWLSEQIRKITDQRITEMEQRLRPLIEAEVRRTIAETQQSALPAEAVYVPERSDVRFVDSGRRASPDQVEQRLAERAAEGDEAMRRPVHFNEFRSRNAVRLFGMNEVDEIIEISPDSSRQTQWFWSLTDDASGLSGLYFGYYAKSSAEMLRANPAQLETTLGKYFEIARGSGRLIMLRPAIVRIELGHLSVLRKGRIEF